MRWQLAAGWNLSSKWLRWYRRLWFLLPLVYQLACVRAWMPRLIIIMWNRRTGDQTAEGGGLCRDRHYHTGIDRKKYVQYTKEYLKILEREREKGDMLSSCHDIKK